MIPSQMIDYEVKHSLKCLEKRKTELVIRLAELENELYEINCQIEQNTELLKKLEVNTC